jgi:RNA polymerase sigma-70 factor (ECF subfamily)
MNATALARAAPSTPRIELLHRTRRPGPSARTRAAPARLLDAESRAWWLRLHGTEPVRDAAIAELHERLRREAWQQIRLRTRGVSDFPSSDLDDLAVQAADDALLVVLRKLDDFRGDSQFWTWARRFAQIEAPVSIRRRLGRDRPASDPECVLTCPDPGCSPEEHAEIRETLRELSNVIVGRLTGHQRTVLIAIAIDGVSPARLAIELGTTPGAIHKTMHDARKRLAAPLTRSRTRPRINAVRIAPRKHAGETWGIG